MLRFGKIPFTADNDRHPVGCICVEAWKVHKRGKNVNKCGKFGRVADNYSECLSENIWIHSLISLPR